MVREIIHVQVGQCGNQVGTRFWQSVTKEHNLGTDNGKWKQPVDAATGKPIKFDDADGDGIPDEIENVNVYFRENSNSNRNSKNPQWMDETRTPRAVLVDLEPGTLEVIKKGPLKDLFDPAAMKFGSNGAGNNWAKGHYTEGAEIVEGVMECIRKEVEKADCTQGFQLFHSLGGGTGSGMGTLLLLKIRDAYPDKITCTYSVFPSPKVSDTVVEPYNAVLSSHQLLENSDETFIVDNEALYNIMHNVLKKKTVEYSVLNELIAKVTCGITSSIRFPGMLNGDLRKLGVNLVPFPRLHFFLCSYAPLTANENKDHSQLTVASVTEQVVSARNFYCNIKPNDGKVLATSFMFRGSSKFVQSKMVDTTMKNVQEGKGNLKIDFVDWIPNNIKSGICRVSGDDEMSCTMIANTTALKGIFQRLATQFGAMYRRKAFLHWYKGEGMDEMEFQEADKNVRDLITEYQDKQDATYEDEQSENDDNSES